MDNTSGQGSASAIPPGIDRWNWGAFLLNWIWGIFNNTWLALLVFVPFVGLIMMIVLGLKGNIWAWQNKRWDSVEEFQRVQRKWAKWSLIGCLAGLCLAVALAVGVFSMISHSDAAKFAQAQVRQSEEVIEAVGVPMEFGFPSGGFEESGGTGSAHFSFSVSGPKGKGEVSLDLVKEKPGGWQLKDLAFEPEGSAKGSGKKSSGSV